VLVGPALILTTVCWPASGGDGVFRSAVAAAVRWLSAFAMCGMVADLFILRPTAMS